MSKKIILILGIFVILGLALFLIFGSKPQTQTEGGGGFSIRDYLPFGKNDVGNITPTTQTEDKNISSNNQNLEIPKLRKISNEPVSGAIIFNVGSTSVIRFVEKGTGNVYEAQSDSVNITRLTNTTIPKIIRSFWLPDGSGFLAQTLVPDSEIIETSFVKLNKTTSSSTNENLNLFETKVSKLPTGIKEISIKPDGSKIFYYTIKEPFSTWFIANPDGTNSTPIQSSALTEWLPNWFNQNLIEMENKSSGSTITYSYIYDQTNKTFKKNGIASFGLSVNPKNNKEFSLFSSGGNFPKLYIFDHNSFNTQPINLNTLAEKCIWLNSQKLSIICAAPTEITSGLYPDDWYQGKITTNDTIRKLDLEKQTEYVITYPEKEIGQKIDVTDIQISKDEKFLLFKNKIDGYLWLLNLEQSN